MRYENIQELLNGIQEFSKNSSEENLITLGDFLVDVALLTDADNEKEEDKNKVSLMTIHAAKGLEFKHVYIVGLEEDLFPSMLSKNSRSDLEEERRLFYVALTRAKVKATLSFAANRFRWGNLIQCEPSRFLDEIDPSYLKNVSSKPERSFINSNHGSPLKNKFFSKPHRLKKVSKIVEKLGDTNHQNTNELKIGDEVQHERFGKGKVIELNGDFPNTKATVFFASAGQKQLLLKFAKLQLIKN